MRQWIYAAATTLSLATFGALAPAQALPVQPGIAAPTDVQQTQFIFGGRNYCFYPNGWNGPGFYWCGYAWRRGFGWGGGRGWHGWDHRRPHMHAEDRAAVGTQALTAADVVVAADAEVDTADTTAKSGRKPTSSELNKEPGSFRAPCQLGRQFKTIDAPARAPQRVRRNVALTAPDSVWHNQCGMAQPQLGHDEERTIFGPRRLARRQDWQRQWCSGLPRRENPGR